VLEAAVRDERGECRHFSILADGMISAMSRLEQALASDRLAITAELPAVDGGGMAEVERRLAPVRDWVDAVNVTDNTAAHAHASSLAVSIATVRCGVEPVMQLVGRDRNRLALQSEIVGAAMYAIENICCLTGDDVGTGDEPEARPVFDLGGRELVALARTLSEGRYLSGRAIDPAPRLFIGAVGTAGAPPFDLPLRLALEKADAGARFLQLQIGFVPEHLEAFMAQADERGLTERVAIMPSISILRSARALHFLNERVPGVEVPDSVIERVEASADEEAECFELAYELSAHAASLPGVAGLHLISFRPDSGVAELCARLGIAPLAERTA
jgi:methylenetetrahydrofolate reductase (NADPH)